MVPPVRTCEAYRAIRAGGSSDATPCPRVFPGPHAHFRPWRIGALVLRSSDSPAPGRPIGQARRVPWRASVQNRRGPHTRCAGWGRRASTLQRGDRRERPRGADRAPLRRPVRTERRLRSRAREAHHEPQRSALRGGRDRDLRGSIRGGRTRPARRAWMAGAPRRAGTPRGDRGARHRGGVLLVLCGDPPRGRDRGHALSPVRARLLPPALVAGPGTPPDAPACTRHRPPALRDRTGAGRRGLSRLCRGLAAPRHAALLAAFPSDRAARAPRHTSPRAHRGALHLGRHPARAVLALAAGGGAPSRDPRTPAAPAHPRPPGRGALLPGHRLLVPIDRAPRPGACHGDRRAVDPRALPGSHLAPRGRGGVAPPVGGSCGDADRRHGVRDGAAGEADGAGYFPTIEMKLTQRPGAPPKLWVRPSFGLAIWRGPASPRSWSHISYIMRRPLAPIGWPKLLSPPSGFTGWGPSPSKRPARTSFHACPRGEKPMSSMRTSSVGVKQSCTSAMLTSSRGSLTPACL